MKKEGTDPKIAIIVSLLKNKAKMKKKMKEKIDDAEVEEECEG